MQQVGGILIDGMTQIRSFLDVCHSYIAFDDKNLHPTRSQPKKNLRDCSWVLATVTVRFIFNQNTIVRFFAAAAFDSAELLASDIIVISSFIAGLRAWV